MTEGSTSEVPLRQLLREAEKAAQAADRQTVVVKLEAAIASSLQGGQPLPKAVFHQLGLVLHELGRGQDAERILRQGLARHPKELALHNLLGVVLKSQHRYHEALEALAQAERLDAKSLMPKVNRGNVLIALRDGPKAVRVFRDLVQRQPRQAEYLRQLGVAYRLCGNFDAALRQFELARRLDARDERTWLDHAGTLADLYRLEDALALIERGLSVVTRREPLLIAQVQTLRRLGRVDEVRRCLEAVLASEPKAAWAHHQWALTLASRDRDAANRHFEVAVRLEPGNLKYRVDLADSLDRTRGPDESRHIDRSYQLARECVDQFPAAALRPHSRCLRSILERCADHERAGRLGSFAELGEFWVNSGQAAALHHQLGRVSTPEDRRTLVEHHRLCGRQVDAQAAGSPLHRPEPRPRNGRIRVGIMSSDLRDHPVSYFVLPLLEGYDRSRFEFFCYSWSSKPADAVQQRIAQCVTAFRCEPHLTARAAAQLIADDDLDILFELGGTTDMNKLDVMAWRPAPVQVSWLGYPHSAGLETIDHILVDPWIQPDDPGLLIERPFRLDHSWVVLGDLGFHDRHVIEPGLPQDRAGRITFGTMNNPYKFHPDALSAWAEVVRRTEGSRFVVVRPEGGVPSFRDNIGRAFERSGVSRDRVEFVPARGNHMRHYNLIDIALDTFPQTGGTTTCESLWMGVPVVSLVGEAFFERLSYSNLNNAGLGDLCAFSREAYIDKALALAADRERRLALRHGLRAQIRARPLGRPDLFVEDFQRAVEHVVREAALKEESAP